MAAKDMAWRPLIELLAGLGLLELDLWGLRDVAPGWARGLAYAGLIGVIVASHHRRKRTEGPPTARAAPGRAWAEAAVVTGVLVAVLLLASAWLRFADEPIVWPFQGDRPGKQLGWAAAKVASAVGQQLALQMFLWPLCREWLGRQWLAVLAAGGLFALVHLPSPALVAITGLAGLVWVTLYTRSGDLRPLVASHVVLATLAHAALPDRLNYDLQVGSAALRERPRFLKMWDLEYRQAERNVRATRDLLPVFASEGYYASCGGTDRGFLAGLHRDVLGREATAEELRAWAGRLATRRRAEVVAHFLGSPENRFLQPGAKRPTLAGLPRHETERR